MSNVVEIFCLGCKDIFKYKRTGVLHQYTSDNSIRENGESGKKVKCTCGCTRLKFNGYLSKDDFHGSQEKNL
jgi:hypothetical protein